MSDYKPSLYNILLKGAEPYLLFNTLRLSLSEIEKEKIGTVVKYLNKGIVRPLAKDDLDTDLITGGFLVPSEFDELGYLKLNYFKTKFSTDTLELVILLTKACNFKCSYCFENTNHIEHITQDKMASLIRFAEERVKKARVMFVSWFGGEPLLRFGVIEELTKHFMRLCSKYSCRYAAYLTTNGYLLTRSVADRMSELKIESIMITLDGPQEVHNRRRMLKNGKGTYGVIMDNIDYLLNKAIPVTINVRCNVDKENRKHLRKWIATFPPSFKAKIHFNFSIATSGGEANCAALKRKKFCMNARGGGSIADLYNYASDEGFSVEVGMRRQNHYCSRDKANHFLIGTDLSLIDCPIVPKRIGYITQDGRAEFDLTEHVNWLSKDPFLDNECKICKLLPLCFGGCNLARVKRGKKACTLVKYDIEKWVRILHKVKRV